MPTVKVRNLKNEEVADLELSDAVFGAEYNEGLVHAAVKNFLANGRAGTVGTKTRGDVSGSGRKLWKQKGTGRARIASIRSPLWKGGGNVHGPQPRDWSYSLPKKMKRGALRAALSERLREGNLVVIDELAFSAPKTKDFIGALKSLGFDGRTLVVDSMDNDNLLLSSRNVKGAKIVGSSGLNVYDVLYHEKLIISRTAVDQITRALDPNASEGSGATEEAA
ncbi:MAG: large subunit ribosomal protein [Acidobacteriota bacterium]|nr:large subunit ribosomal protein [Acidobacteriota bacterium]